MNSPGSDIVIRRATVADAPTIAQHRAAMFHEMDELEAHRIDNLVDRATRYLLGALESGEYIGWLAAAGDRPGAIIGGAGVQLRRTLPHPREPDTAPHGMQAIVLNVYTVPAWRHRGVAEQLMAQVIAWAGEAGMHTLVLHASTAGRPLYERLGFAATNEMRYGRPLRRPANNMEGRDRD